MPFKKIKNAYFARVFVLFFFFNSINASFLNINGAAIKAFSDLKLFQLNISQAASGESLLPEEAQETVQMVRSWSLSEFSISPALGHDLWIAQNIVTDAWPNRLGSKSESQFFLGDESIPATCILKEKRNKVQLAVCH